MKIQFPPVDQADEHGIVWIGGSLTVENLRAAYSQGIFPWPHEGLPLLWFCPEQRGILRFSDFRIPRSTQRELKKASFETTFDTCFEKVIKSCSLQRRSGQRGTWITQDMQEIYIEMHRKGLAHSVECWFKGELVGGLYGVYIQGVFSGESMFHSQTAASKQCVVTLVEQLHKMGHEWFDIQMVTPVLETFGGSYVSREDYLLLLKSAQQKNIHWGVS